MTAATYTLAFTDNILTHYPQSPLLVQDDLAFDRSVFEAQLRSGDYFATLATRLDELSERLEGTRTNDKAALRAVVDELLFLQQNYAIIKKLHEWTDKAA